MQAYSVATAKGVVPEVDLIRYSVTKGTFNPEAINAPDGAASEKMSLNVIIKPKYANFPYSHATITWDEEAAEIDHVLIKLHRKFVLPEEGGFGWPIALSPYNAHCNKRGEVRLQDNPGWSDLHHEFRSIRDTFVIVNDWAVQPNGDLHIRAVFGHGQLVEKVTPATLEIKSSLPDAEIARLFRLAAEQNLGVRIAA